MTDKRDYKSDDVEARSYLIAAAPDMKEALETAEAVLEMVEPRSDKYEYLTCLQQVRAALAKARGSQ